MLAHTCSFLYVFKGRTKSTSRPLANANASIKNELLSVASVKFSFFYCVDTAGCFPRLPEVHSKPSLIWHKEQYYYLQLVFIWGSVLHSPLPLSVRGSCSMVLVCGPVMCHLCLKVAIILSALRANKGCHPVGTHLWLFSRENWALGLRLQSTSPFVLRF